MKEVRTQLTPNSVRIQNYYPNGQLFEDCTFKDWKLDGHFRLFYPDGQLIVDMTFKDGEIVQREWGKR